MKIAIGAETRFDCIDSFQIAILGSLTYLKILVTNFCKEFRRILSRIIDFLSELSYLVIYRHYFIPKLVINLSSDLILSSDI